jgi:gamma-glutamylcyclotransferase (GGCT)/AIG2-like uncharacterized protein YtfP
VIEYICIYGTLRPAIAPPEIKAMISQWRRIGDGSIAGRIYNLGEYPGAVLDQRGSDWIAGEVFELPNDGVALALLDAYEGFDPLDLDASLFVRCKREVMVEDSAKLECWVYVYNRPVSASTIIQGGDYLMAVKAKEQKTTRAVASRKKNSETGDASGITDFNEIHAQLRKILAKYSPPLTAKNDTPTAYNLYSVKDLVIAGRNFKEVYFAGTVIHKNIVSLYFFPVYTHPQSFGDLPEELKKCLKGKNCFNFKKIDSKLLKQIEKMAKDGFKIYKQEKWI